MRVAAGMALLMAGTALWVLGAQPVAVGLFSSPWDKLAHIATFALIGCAAGIASGAKGWFRIACCVAASFAVGAADEMHQVYLPGRSASWADLAADAAGGLTGAALLHFTEAFWSRQFRNR